MTECKHVCLESLIKVDPEEKPLSIGVCRGCDRPRFIDEHYELLGLRIQRYEGRIRKTYQYQKTHEKRL